MKMVLEITIDILLKAVVFSSNKIKVLNGEVVND